MWCKTSQIGVSIKDRLSFTAIFDLYQECESIFVLIVMSHSPFLSTVSSCWRSFFVNQCGKGLFTYICQTIYTKNGCQDTFFQLLVDGDMHSN